MKRKVLHVIPFTAMTDRIRYRLALECGHTVSRSRPQPVVRCEECKAEGQSHAD